MASVAPPHQYHPPRHPGSFVPTTPRSSTSYYPSSTSTVPTSYSIIGPPSSISTSSSPRLNPGLAAARHATKTPGKLHKRGRSFLKNREETVDDVDEGFFSGPGSPPPSLDHYDHPSHSHSHPASVSVAAHRARGKIKPLLKKVSGSRSNSLDLSRSDGGLPNGVGLGIYDGAGYDSSGIEDDSPFAYRHRRNFSQTSGSSPLLVGANQTFSHPKRQLPRRGGYTPDVTQYSTSNESSDESDNEHAPDKTRRSALGGSKSPVPGGLHLNTGRSTPMLPTLSMTDLHQRARTPSIQMTTPISPVSPMDLPSAAFPSNVSQHGIKASFKRSHNRARSSLDKSVSETAPSFEASVTAARLAWEAKEEKKEEKRERKRRRSEAKEEERSRATSRCSGRGRGNSGSSSQQHWSREADFDDDDIVIGGVIKEKVGGFEGFDESRTSSTSRNDSRGRHGTGKKWGLSGKSEAPNTKRKRPGFKKRWLGFVVWVRIGVVRMQRRLGF